MTTWIMTDDLPNNGSVRQWVQHIGTCLMKVSDSVDTEGMDDKEFCFYVSEHCGFEIMSSRDVFKLGSSVAKEAMQRNNGGEKKP